MGNRKSLADVEFYVGLLRNVLADAYACFPEIPQSEFRRDIITIENRVRCEGFQFLTQTLPSLGKALDLALESGHLNVPPAFSRKSKSGVRWNIPKLFSALFMTVFNIEGHLVHDKKTAVGMIRQLCFLCYKVEYPYTTKQVKTCLDSFVDTDFSLPSVNTGSGDTAIAFRYARFLLRRLFRGFNPLDIAPRHGPGAVADHLRGREKYKVQFYDPELDRLYPYSVYTTFRAPSLNPEFILEHRLLTREIPTARVVCVPKDSRGPRIISCEPALLQYLQQGLAREIYWLVENHRLTRGRVFFTDQSSHQRLAERSSIDGRFATLDMCDASDRVSLDLVKALFPEELLPYLLATRSKTTRLPDGRVVELKKFAPMGSALCFPIEALVFYSLACGAVWAVRRGRISVKGPVFVFGDDIIVPTKIAPKIITVLESFGLKFNRNKCFIRGKFRESCGRDAFNGENVTPVRIRVLRTHALKSRKAESYSLSMNANALFDKGYWAASRYLHEEVEKCVGLIPTTSSSFSGISRSSNILPNSTPLPMGAPLRWNDDLQRLEVKTITLRSSTFISEFPDEFCRLGYNLIQGMVRPYDPSVAVPHSALPKAGWEPLL